MTATYTENVVANTQLNFVQELLNIEVVFSYIILWYLMRLMLLFVKVHSSYTAGLLTLSSKTVF